MQQTLASMTVLLPVAEFLKRVDPLAIGKLASDVQGLPVTPANLLTDPNVAAALLDASGVFESAVARGGRYSMLDLQTILANPTTIACGTMWRIISDVSWALLFERRPNKDVPIPASMTRSLQWLDDLSDGKKIFAFIQSEDAGAISKHEASVEDVFERNGAVVQAEAFYGRRSDQTRRRGGW